VACGSKASIAVPPAARIMSRIVEAQRPHFGSQSSDLKILLTVGFSCKTMQSSTALSVKTLQEQTINRASELPWTPCYTPWPP
jgi:hypothetical protein